MREALRALDLRAGREGWGAAFKERGHEYVPLELFRGSPWQMAMDVRTFARNPGGVLDALVRPGWRPDLVLASPPCQGCSVASIGVMRDDSPTGPVPKHPTAESGLTILSGVQSAIRTLAPSYYWIQNPRGIMRRMPQMANLPRVTVTYCSYGETRQKPSDLWGRFPATWAARPFCTGDPRHGTVDHARSRYVLDAAGRPCHTAAPRGSRTPGRTQGMGSSAERAVIPYELSLDVCLAAEASFQVRPAAAPPPAPVLAAPRPAGPRQSALGGF